MSASKNSGMTLRISHWVGRLGNHLIQLSNAIYVAQRTKSLLIVPQHEIVRQRKYDFRQVKSAESEQRSAFFWPHECLGFPILYDAIRRDVLKSFVLPFLQQSSWIRRLLGSMRKPRIDEDTLLINIRSGEDIFRQQPPPQSDYMQPPFAFYQKIIEENGYRKCLIVTEKPPNLNPVIPALLKWNRGISLNVHQSIRDDILLVLNSRHLVLAHSSFSWCLALMSERLQCLHQPYTFQIRSIPDIVIKTYQMKNYIEPGTWTASDAQMRFMLEYPADEIYCSMEDQAESRKYSCFGVTNDDVQLEAIRLATAGKVDGRKGWTKQ
jgi:hypothetical protein